MSAVTVSVQADGARSVLARADATALVRAVLRGERVRTALLSITYLSRRRMAALNRRHLGHAGATDVIAFGFRDAQGATIGDVYICPEVAREHAHAFGCPVREELARLVIHGTLHVVGYDHPAGEERVRSPMWRRQEHLLRRWRAA